jgi:hypothetical protein
MDVGKEELLADEKALLGEVLGLLEEVVPEVRLNLGYLGFRVWGVWMQDVVPDRV